MDIDVTTDDASAKMVSTLTQDSVFLRLPFEIRYEIYNHLIHLKDTKTLSMEVTLDPASSLDPLTRLLSVSRQVRREVYTLIVTVTTFHLKISREQSLISRTRSRVGRRVFRERIVQHVKEEIKDDKAVPHNFKFWKVCISILNTGGQSRTVADIDFRKKEFCIAHAHWCDFRDDEHTRSLKKTISREIQKFTKKEGFDGMTVQDMSRFLEQIDMPNPYGFWRQEEISDGLKEIPDDKVNDETDLDLTEGDLPFRRRFDRGGFGFRGARHGFGRLRAGHDRGWPLDEDEP